MDTMRIRAILAAAEYKSLSRAAEEFSYTPSALSHMADALEAELGIKILARTRAGVSLTKEGALLKQKLNTVLLAEQELKAAAAAFSNIGEAELRIGTYASISTYLLPAIVKRFKRENSEVRVSITVADALRGWLENDEADVIFGDRAAVFENEHQMIMEDRYVAVLREGVLPGRRTVNREELYQFSYISTNESSLRKYFDEEKFAEILRYDSVDDTSVLSLVKEGIGVAVLPSLAVRKPVRGVRILRLNPAISRSIGFAYRKKTPVIERFVSFMKDFKL